MSKNVKANLLLRLFKPDEQKQDKIRKAHKDKTFKRRDAAGTVVADNKLTEDKGKPPKKDPKP